MQLRCGKNSVRFFVSEYGLFIQLWHFGMNIGDRNPEFILFAQHGWSDNGKDINTLAVALATQDTVVIAPSLGLINTYWRIKPLVNKLEKLVREAIGQYPQARLKIIGHSLGGLIWLELLDLHPEWHAQVHSFVLIGSPVGGSHLARLIDPLGLGIGMARDLGKNRRALATKIAQKIPTLAIASDLGNGSDGMVTLENTKFNYAHFICVNDIPHAHLKCHQAMIPLIQDFWLNPQINLTQIDWIAELLTFLKNIPGMTDANYQNLAKSQVLLRLTQGLTVHTYTNLAKIEHIFVTNAQQQCLYAGYVGWLHSAHLHKSLLEIKKLFPTLD